MPAAGLIDELRLAIALVVGGGRRLFPGGGAPAGARPRVLWSWSRR
ncbi:hypothetical protein ABZ454_23560 [Streptomyces sp. NPDC005803]